MNFLNREVTPAYDVVLAAVLREATRLGTQAAMESMPLPSVALLRQKSTVDDTSLGYTKRSVQCYECIKFGHVAVHCPKKKNFYAYCMIIGHHISDCHRHSNRSRLAHQDVTKWTGSFPSLDMILKG